MANSIGYIVTCECKPMVLVKERRHPRRRYGVLYFGVPPRASLFTSKAQARGAIKRTNEERVEYNGRTFEEEFGRCFIYRVEHEW